MVWSSLLVQRGLWLWSLGRCWDGQSGEASRPTRAGAVLPAVSGKQISWATAGVTQMETKKKKKNKTFHIWIKSPERPRLTPPSRPPALAPSGPPALIPVCQV